MRQCDREILKVYAYRLFLIIRVGVCTVRVGFAISTVIVSQRHTLSVLGH